MAFAIPLGPAWAQQDSGARATDTASAEVVASPIVKIDQDRLYRESAYGQSIIAQLEQEAAALAAENHRIEAELEAEELELTEKRPGMEAAEFRALAIAFDERVVDLRAQQDAKAREFRRRSERAPQQFFQEIAPVIGELAAARGAVVVLDASAVLLSASQIDITDAVVAHLDQLFQARKADDGAAEQGNSD